MSIVGAAAASAPSTNWMGKPLVEISRSHDLGTSGWGPFTEQHIVSRTHVGRLVKPIEVGASYEDALNAAREISLRETAGHNRQRVGMGGYPAAAVVVQDARTGAYHAGILIGESNEYVDTSPLVLLPIAGTRPNKQNIFTMTATPLSGDLKAVVGPADMIEFVAGKPVVQTKSLSVKAF